MVLAANVFKWVCVQTLVLDVVQGLKRERGLESAASTWDWNPQAVCWAFTMILEADSGLCIYLGLSCIARVSSAKRDWNT